MWTNKKISTVFSDQDSNHEVDDSDYEQDSSDNEKQHIRDYVISGSVLNQITLFPTIYMGRTFQMSLKNILS